ncbi:MAG: hypothetical protein ACRELX_17695, partial [Longimicrobiales bacterium]
LVLVASPLLAGPPWISVELPSNPHHPATRDALFLVHAYHHDASIAAQLAGTAEGLVDGKRRSLPLAIAPTSRAGVYAVRGDVPRSGAWVLVLTLAQGAESTATALVRLGRDGTVAGVTVPSDRSADGWTVPRAVQASDVDAALRDVARIAALETASAATSHFAIAGLAGIPLVLLMVGLARSRRPS